MKDSCDRTHRLLSPELVVRVNATESKLDVLGIPESAWFDRPDGDDISVAPIDPNQASGWNVTTIGYFDAART